MVQRDGNGNKIYRLLVFLPSRAVVDTKSRGGRYFQSCVVRQNCEAPAHWTKSAGNAKYGESRPMSVRQTNVQPVVDTCGESPLLFCFVFSAFST